MWLTQRGIQSAGLATVLFDPYYKLINQVSSQQKKLQKFKFLNTMLVFYLLANAWVKLPKGLQGIMKPNIQEQKLPAVFCSEQQVTSYLFLLKNWKHNHRIKKVLWNVIFYVFLRKFSALKRINYIVHSLNPIDGLSTNFYQKIFWTKLTR